MLLITFFCNTNTNLLLLMKPCLTEVSFFIVFTPRQQFLFNFKRQEDVKISVPTYRSTEQMLTLLI